VGLAVNLPPTQPRGLMPLPPPPRTWSTGQMRRAMAVAVVLALVGAGCDGGEASDQTATSAVESTETTAPDSTTTIIEPTTTIMESTTTTSTTTTIADPGESMLLIDFYAMGTEGISVSRRGGEILVIEGFDEPPLLRITADDIEAITDSWYGIDLTVSEEIILSVRDLGIGVRFDHNVFRVTIGETTTWGWLWDPFNPLGTETPEILFPVKLRNYLPLWPLGAMVGDVPLDLAIKDAWLRSQE